MRSDRAAIAFVVLLLGASAAAFAITQQLKLEETAITDTRVTNNVFSPVCRCDKAATSIRFTLRPRDRMTATIVDGDGRTVRTLARDVPAAPGDHSFRWDGRRDDGRVVPEGPYRARVELDEAGRRITLANRIVVDTTRPRVRPLPLPYRWISPDRDGRHDTLLVRYRVDEPAQGLLFVDGIQSQRVRAQKLSFHHRWFGMKGDRRLPPGVYRLSLGAEDLAGNRAPRTRPVRVEIRFVDIVRRTIRVRARGVLRVRVRTDVRTLRYRLADRRGVFRGRVLRLRAPRRPGRYRLIVSTHRHRDRATVAVRRR